MYFSKCHHTIFEIMKEFFYSNRLNIKTTHQNVFCHESYKFCFKIKVIKLYCKCQCCFKSTQQYISKKSMPIHFCFQHIVLNLFFILKTTLLKNMIKSKNLEYIMEAHNGLSAKIVEEAGFKGIWGSGLSISAQLGVRDSNEASWTQVLDVLEFMSDNTSIPILLDADTGYGNFNNARRLVRKLEQRGVAGACIEDKLFPKTNSLLDNRQQPLADIEEFSFKIKAMKDTQKDPDFCVVARVEAFIAGWGLDEALKRAESYIKAGADAILMHSKKSDPSDIEAFMKAWNNQV
jgi:phosphoenolpyruvate phosphomutase